MAKKGRKKEKIGVWSISGLSNLVLLNTISEHYRNNYQNTVGTIIRTLSEQLSEHYGNMEQIQGHGNL